MRLTLLTFGSKNNYLSRHPDPDVTSGEGSQSSSSENHECDYQVKKAYKGGKIDYDYGIAGELVPGDINRITIIIVRAERELLTAFEA